MSKTSSGIHRWLRLLLALALAAGVVLLFALDGHRLIARPQALVAWLREGDWRAITLFGVVFVVAGAICVPPAVFVVAAGLLWPFPAAFGGSLAGGMGAACFGFVLSRYLARDFCARHIPTRLRRYNAHLRRRGIVSVIVLRALFFLFPPLNWMLGLSHVRLRDYVLGTLVGALPGLVVYTFLGDGLLPWVVDQPPAYIALAAAGVGLLLLLGVGLRTRLANRRLDDEAEDALDRRPTPRSAVSLGLFLRAAVGFVRLTARAFVPPPPYRRPPRLRRCLLLAAAAPLFACLQGVHWLALWLDDVLYPAYRRVEPEAPVFIVGIPRSGTTFLHRVLARDEETFSTFALWELLFAPAICERRLLQALAAVDRLVGAPGRRVFGWLTRRLTGEVKDVHRISLSDAEEDFLLLLPVLACYLLVLAYPFAPSIQGLARFDDAVAADRREGIMQFYRGLLQRHLFVRGSRTILSKNVSFTPMLRSLLQTFPDARVVGCMRTPHEAVPSHISSMAAGWRFFGLDQRPETYHARWLEVMDYAYAHLADTLAENPRGCMVPVDMGQLRGDLDGTVEHLYRAFDLDLPPAFREKLAEEAAAARAYRSRQDRKSVV